MKTVKERILIICYLIFLIAGLVAFLPIREAVYMSYNNYTQFAGYWAIGYALLAAVLVHLTSRDMEKKEKRLMTLISFGVSLPVLLLLFFGVQLFHDHVIIH